MSTRRGKRSAPSDSPSSSRPPAQPSNKQTLQECVEKLSDTEFKDLKMIFRLTDGNGDGSITTEEMKGMLQDKLDICVDDSLLDDLMSSAGAQPRGLISETQFISWFLKMQSLTREEAQQDVSDDLLAAFRLFDKDENGFITKDELKRAMDLIDENLTEAELDSLITTADSDKDGRINYQEN